MSTNDKVKSIKSKKKQKQIKNQVLQYKALQEIAFPIEASEENKEVQALYLLLKELPVFLQEVTGCIWLLLAGYFIKGSVQSRNFIDIISRLDITEFAGAFSGAFAGDF